LTATLKLKIPSKFQFLFRKSRYKVAHGGRGGAKSWNFADALILMAYERRLRILCAREFQNSITESVHELLRGQIERLGLGRWFDVQNTVITSHVGSEFIFSGIRQNVTKIKSMEGLDIVWVEEAEKVSARSWEVLIPTVRKAGSEIWVTLNPDLETDPTYKRFIATTPDDCIVQQVSWRDNPFFPEELRREKDYLARVDPDAYAHVWEGSCRISSDAQIMRGKYIVQAFEAPATGWDGPYLGADWGFARDPSTLVKTWVHERKLFIEYEAYGIGVDTDKIADLFDRIPRARDYQVRADNARPETISYMQQHGYPRMVGVDKWAGSVEDGIAFIRQFEQIIIHPRCKHTAEEARLYSYKQDNLSGDVLPDIVDKHNHIWDAVRYALAPLIKRTGFGFIDFANAEVARMEAEKKERENPTDGR
jgi:phage terminase large subunit